MNIKEIHLGSLTDAEMTALYDIVSTERTRRDKAKIRAGVYPAPSAAEKALWASGKGTAAIITYRERARVSGHDITILGAAAVLKGV